MLHASPFRYKNCVVSLFLDKTESKYAKLAEITIPTFIRYSRRIDADFHLIQHREFLSAGWFETVWEKLQLRNLLEIYDRVLFVDLDCYITKFCPNIFADHEFGVFAAITYPDGGVKEYPEYLKFMGHKTGLDGNSGVMLIDRQYKDCLNPPKNREEQTKIFNTSEQLWIFCNMFWNDVKIEQLKPFYHQMNQFDKQGIFHFVNSNSVEAKISVAKEISGQDW